MSAEWALLLSLVAAWISPEPGLVGLVGRRHPTGLMSVIANGVRLTQATPSNSSTLSPRGSRRLLSVPPRRALLMHRRRAAAALT